MFHKNEIFLAGVIFNLFIDVNPQKQIFSLPLSRVLLSVSLTAIITFEETQLTTLNLWFWSMPR